MDKAMQKHRSDPQAKPGQLTFIEPEARRLYALFLDMLKDLAVEVTEAIKQEWPPAEIKSLMDDRKAAMEPIFNAVQAAWHFENTHPFEKEVH